MKVLTFDSFVNKPVVTECVVSNLQATNHNIRSDQNYCCLDGFHLKKNPKDSEEFLSWEIYRKYNDSVCEHVMFI